MKEKITFDKFTEISKQLEIKLGTVQSAERVAGTDKLLKLEVFFSDADRRTVVTNIGATINPSELMFVQFPFITNLEPAKIKGITSTAMIMVPTIDEKIELTAPSGSVLM